MLQKRVCPVEQPLQKLQLVHPLPPPPCATPIGRSKHIVIYILCRNKSLQSFEYTCQRLLLVMY